MAILDFTRLTHRPKIRVTYVTEDTLCFDHDLIGITGWVAFIDDKLMPWRTHDLPEILSKIR